MTGSGRPLIDALGWALLHFVWQGFLVGVLTMASLRLLRRARPQIRYGLACGALGLCLALPVVGVSRAVVGTTLDRPASRLQTRDLPTVDWPPALPGRARTVVRDADVSLEPWLPIIVTLWAGGAALLSLRLAAGLARTARLGGSVSLPVESEWTDCLRRLADRLGLDRTVRLKVSAAIDTPLTLGWWRPVVFVPAGLLTGMSPALLEALLAHELAHVARYDYLVNLLQSAAEVVLFYHPAVWWISRRIGAEREQVADDLAAAALGERRRLALALQALDRLQAAAPQFAQTARGGYLMNRIRRLVFPESQPLARSVALCAIAAAVAGAVIATVSVYSASPVGTPAGVRSEPYQPPLAAGTVTGQWRLRLDPADPGSAYLELRYVTSHGESTSGHTVSVDQLAGLNPGAATRQGAVHVEVRRPAGTIACDGTMRAGEGSGTFVFTPSAAFVSEMGGLGYTGLSLETLFSLALHDVSTQFVRDLSAAGYKAVPVDKLVALRIHGATADFARSMATLLGQLPGVDQLIAMRIHGVTPDDTRQLQDQLGKDLTADNLVALRIHEATPDYVRAMKNLLGTTLSADQVIAMRIHGVTPDDTRQLQDLLGKDLTADNLVALRVHEATPDYVRAMKNLLGTTLSADQVIAMRIHGVTPDDTRQLQNLLGKGLTADNLVALRIHEVTAGYVKSILSLGYDRVSVDQLVALRIHDIVADYVKRAKARAGRNLSLDEVVAMKIRGQ